MKFDTKNWVETGFLFLVCFEKYNFVRSITNLVSLTFLILTERVGSVDSDDFSKTSEGKVTPNAHRPVKKRAIPKTAQNGESSSPQTTRVRPQSVTEVKPADSSTRHGLAYNWQTK